MNRVTRRGARDLRPFQRFAVAGALSLAAAVFAIFIGSTSADAARNADNNPLNLVHPGELTVANFGTQYPGVIVKGNTITGIVGDLLNDFAKKSNLKIKLFTTSFASSILAVTQRRADVAVSFFWNPDRSKQVSFSVPYYQESSVVITNKSKVRYTGPASLKGKRIGVIVGTIYTPIVRKAFPSSDTTIYPGIPEAGKALINGQIDALIEATSTFNAPPLAGSKAVAVFPIKLGEFGFTAESLGFTTSNIANCKNAALINALDTHLWSLEITGKYAKMVDKYKKYGASYKLIPRYGVLRGGCNG